jgi:protein phosphatase
MDKIAIISDVHGNLTALNAVLKDIDSKGITKIYCLGDCVTKCAHPDKVIDILRKKCEIIIKGNCDDVICRPNVEFGRFWSRDIIGEEKANFLYNCPVSTEFYMSGHLIRLFHASPFSLEHVFNPMYSNLESSYSHLTINNPEDLFKNTKFLGKTPEDPIPDVIGYGHLHTPNLFRFKNKTIFNVGSVGVPVEMMNESEDDETNRFSTMASYMYLEGHFNSKKLSTFNITLVRIPYCIEDEIKALEDSNMPNKEMIIKSLKTAIH